METILNYRGYGIPVSAGPDVLARARALATIRPNMEHMKRVVGFVPQVKYEFYAEGSKYLYLPRHLAVREFGPPKKQQWLYQKANLGPFKGTLRPVQQLAVDAYLASAAKGHDGLICLPCGMGKCLGIDTPIMMFDGSIKKVQDIRVGDKLMGDDSTSRTVLSLARGRETMYRIIPTKGDPYVVNESHILSLKSSSGKSGKWQKGDIVDMSVRDYLDLPESYHGRGGRLLGYRVPVTFPSKPVDFDPYMIGYWLGDGSSSCTDITTIEEEVLQYFHEELPKYGCSLGQADKSGITYRIRGNTRGVGCNKMRTVLKNHNMLNNKHIPDIYKINDRNVQLQVLAGLIDSDGYCNNSSGYDFVLKSEKLMDDIIFMARSLGFAAYKAKCKKTCTNAPGGPKVGDYFRACITGPGLEQIPVKVPRKKCNPRRQIKDVLMTRIRCENIGEGDYYGFEIDGNRRFLLGDFTVTHNTACSLYIAAQLNLKTLVIVNEETLGQQWAERIAQFLPEARIGRIQGDVCQIDDCDIVIGMLQTLARRSFDVKNTMAKFGFRITDECHSIGSEVYTRALVQACVPYSLGVSATPRRKDGLTEVIHWFMGPTVFEIQRPPDDGVVVQTIRYACDDPAYATRIVNRMGMRDASAMMSQIASWLPRNELIVDTIIKLLEDPGRQILVLTHRRELQLDILKALLAERGLTDEVGILVGRNGEKKAVHEERVRKARDCRVILATYKKAQQGLDIATLNTLVFATPESDVEQSTGRILRGMASERTITPIIVDIIDVNHGNYKRMWSVRRSYYKKNGYTLQDVAVDDDASDDAVSVPDDSVLDNVFR